MITRKVRLEKVIEKDNQELYIITKGGIYFSLTKENIEELKEIFTDIDNKSLIRPQE
jgi:soluble P-type ATPase